MDIKDLAKNIVNGFAAKRTGSSITLTDPKPKPLMLNRINGKVSRTWEYDGVTYDVPDDVVLVEKASGNKNNYAVLQNLVILTTDTIHAEFVLDDAGNRMFGANNYTRCYVASSGNGTSSFCGMSYPIPLTTWVIDGETRNTIDLSITVFKANDTSYTPTGTAADQTVSNFAINTITNSSSGAVSSVSGFMIFCLADSNGTPKVLLHAAVKNSVCGFYDFVSKTFIEPTGTLAAGGTLPKPDDTLGIKGVGEKTENLFDKSAITLNRYMRADGNYGTSTAGLTATDYIQVSAGEDYTVKGTSTLSNTMAFSWFDSSKTILSTRHTKNVGAGEVNWTETAPADAVYLIVNIQTNESQMGDTWMVVEGSTAPSSYIPYGYKISETITPQSLVEGTALPTGATDIAYGNGVFIVIVNGSNKVYRSTDNGVSWSTITLPNSSYYKSVVYANGRFIITGNNWHFAWSADDGATWTTVASPQNYVDVIHPAYGAGVWAAGIYKDWLAISISTDNGETWSNVIPQSMLGYYGQMLYGSQGFILPTVNTSSGSYFKSTDGQTWTLVTDNTFAGGFFAGVYADGTYVYMGENEAAGYALYSDDANTWTKVTLPVSANWVAVAYGDGVLMAVAKGSAVAVVSTDKGRTWSTFGLPGALQWDGIAYGDGKFIAVADGSTTTAVSAESVKLSVYRSSQLMAINNYKDFVEFVSGLDSENIGCKVIDGTESWTAYSRLSNCFYIGLEDAKASQGVNVLCTHYAGRAQGTDKSLYIGATNIGSVQCGAFYFTDTNYSDVTEWTANAAAKYAAGTPIIIWYLKLTANETEMASLNFIPPAETAIASSGSIEVEYRSRTV